MKFFTQGVRILWGHGFSYTSRVYYTSVLGAECIALLCSVSRVASASFIKVIFSDVLVSSTLFIFLSPRRVSTFLAWGDFHARSRFARSTISEEKWGTTRSLP